MVGGFAVLCHLDLLTVSLDLCRTDISGVNLFGSEVYSIWWDPEISHANALACDGVNNKRQSHLFQNMESSRCVDLLVTYRLIIYIYRSTEKWEMVLTGCSTLSHIK